MAITEETAKDALHNATEEILKEKKNLLREKKEELRKIEETNKEALGRISALEKEIYKLNAEVTEDSRVYDNIIKTGKAKEKRSACAA